MLCLLTGRARHRLLRLSFLRLGYFQLGRLITTSSKGI